MSNQDSIEAFNRRFARLMSTTSTQKSSDDGDSTVKDSDNEPKCAAIGGREQILQLTVSTIKFCD